VLIGGGGDRSRGGGYALGLGLMASLGLRAAVAEEVVTLPGAVLSSGARAAAALYTGRGPCVSPHAPIPPIQGDEASAGKNSHLPSPDKRQSARGMKRSSLRKGLP
jgi:hypothetical protein